MISLEQKPNHILELSIHQLVAALIQYKKKPYLPVWGELFTALREIARQGQQTQEQLIDAYLIRKLPTTRKACHILGNKKIPGLQPGRG